MKSISIGSIPVIKVKGKTLPEVWEKSLVRTWYEGIAIKTQYDKPEDPPSRDVSAILVIHEPFTEPRIHRALPTGFDELEIYRQEVVLGIHDHWVRKGGWPYSYHDRLFDYEGFDQIENMIKNLINSFYTRRAQAVTWMTKIDAEHHEPPCLQRVWCRIIEEDGNYFLNMNTHWRSRDAFKAAFMNIFALTELQKMMAKEISKRMGINIRIGRYVDMNDSYHIYGSYFKEFKGFLDTLIERTFKERVYNTSFAEPFFKEARERIEKEKKEEKK